MGFGPRGLRTKGLGTGLDKSNARAIAPPMGLATIQWVVIAGFIAWHLGNFNRDLIGHDPVRMNNEWQFEITNAIWDRRDCVLQMIILLMEGINWDIIRPNVSRSNSDHQIKGFYSIFSNLNFCRGIGP